MTMIRKLTPRIYQLSGPFGTGIWGVNVFLLIDKGLTLVDTGFRGRWRQIIKEVRQLGYSPSDIASIIITHHHADHTGSLAKLKEATKARVLAHPADAPYIDGRLAPPGPAQPSWLSRILTRFPGLWAAPSVTVDGLLNDGDELPLLGGARVWHTPGHTPGSISLFLAQERLLIAGDVLAKRFGLGLPSLAFTTDIAQEINSIKRLAGLDFDIICFGHGGPICHQARQRVINLAVRLDSKNRGRS